MHQLWTVTGLTPAMLTTWAVRLACALLVALIGWWLARWLGRASSRVLQHEHTDPILAGFLRNITFTAVLVLVLVESLEIVGIPSTSLLAAVGAAGLAIGLALNSSLSHIAWGVILVVFRPFRVGDTVTLNGIDGTVESLNLMHTHMRTADNREVVIPNGTVGGNPIYNASLTGQHPFDYRFALPFNIDLDKTIALIDGVLRRRTDLPGDAPPMVDVVGFSANGVVVSVHGALTARTSPRLQHEVLSAVQQALHGEGVVPVAV
ncbi:mechanosensitive ion channel family protein [Dyella kyungheensis]|uniref:Small-conductance mechanosensitive channel n=1 Tax=Dyella kyungheensis TaxID=1242174 RepID=A0ABS2JQV9_9GAMM|nr:mechanosensitive ion channel domain-containing protein [Dyella kyungheensis]MBM7121417.1 mechanosensitive ion channel [Dyella kyungheensis]